MNEEPALGNRRTSAFGPCAPRGLGLTVTLCALFLACGTLLGSCASFDQEIYLAPFASRYSRAGGGTESELVAGAIRFRHDSPRGALTHWALRPLVSEYRKPNGDSLTRFLVPLGTIRHAGEEHVNQLLPIWRYQSELEANGTRAWKFLALPGIFWSQDSSGRVVRAVFPFGGVIENFATFDRIVFVLFPLYMHTEREGRHSTNWLFPLFNRTTGAGGTSGRVFPLFGHNRYAGRYDRWFFLWPFFHFQRNDLAKPESARETNWLFWPLVGHTQRGSYDAWTWLWPFFGYARDTETGFWAWDGPWPFVRVHGGGRHPPSEERVRFWPFFSRYKGDGLEKRNYLWPIVQVSSEDYPDRIRNAQYVLPVWQRWDEVAADGREEHWAKAWPVYQEHRDPDTSRVAFPALNPLWHLPVIDDHYAWIYELWTSEREDAHTVHHDRAWGGIYRRERDRFEDREYWFGFWSRRGFREGGERVEAKSLFFGLLRWQRRGNDGELDWLAPAFPGPGWPLERSREELAPSRAARLLEEGARP